MSIENPNYDVAISFLYEDLSLAQALYDKLSEGLEVFFFPHNQEELAATDGLESMREPFRFQSRLNVVLYRPKWGKTKWTGIEEAAVKESCLDNAYKNLFFLVIEPTNEFPKWLPDTHVRFNYSDFGLDQAIGAIKARVQERGGEYKPMTPAKKAELIKHEEAFRRAKADMSSDHGTQRIFENVRNLFQMIAEQCAEANAQGNLCIEVQKRIQQGDMSQVCTLSESMVGLTVNWHQPIRDTLDSSVLVVCEFNRKMIIPDGYFSPVQPQRIKEDKYDPSLSRAQDYGWQIRRTDAFISNQDLASRIVIQFLDLIERDRKGLVKRER
jgi:hypothetical protein